MRLVDNPRKEGDGDWRVTVSERHQGETVHADRMAFSSPAEAATYYVNQILAGAHFYCPKCRQTVLLRSDRRMRRHRIPRAYRHQRMELDVCAFSLGRITGALVTRRYNVDVIDCEVTRDEAFLSESG